MLGAEVDADVEPPLHEVRETRPVELLDLLKRRSRNARIYPD